MFRECSRLIGIVVNEDLLVASAEVRSERVGEARRRGHLQGLGPRRERPEGSGFPGKLGDPATHLCSGESDDESWQLGRGRRRWDREPWGRREGEHDCGFAPEEGDRDHRAGEIKFERVCAHTFGICEVSVNLPLDHVPVGGREELQQVVPVRVHRVVVLDLHPPDMSFPRRIRPRDLESPDVRQAPRGVAGRRSEDERGRSAGGEVGYEGESLRHSRPGR